MSRITRVFSVILFAAIMYLILAEAASPWFNLPMLGNIGFVLSFVLFSVFHCWAIEGPKRMGIFFAVSAIVTYAMEEIGVRTGLVFGAYHYSDMLGIKLGHVPVLIPLGVVHDDLSLARGSQSHSPYDRCALDSGNHRSGRAVGDGDDRMGFGHGPGHVNAGEKNWVWEKGGIYFGVPGRNYLGWLLTTFLVYWLVGLLWRADDGKSTATRTFAALPVIVYAFFTVRYVATNSFPQLQAVAVFSMGLPAFVSLIQICMNRSVAAQNSEAAADVVATVAEDTISV